jgi:hypothetical protein
MAYAASVEDVAKLLAKEHRKDDSNITEIHWFPHGSEVQLVEVTSSISDKREVLPFRLTPDPPDVPYPSVIILLSPKDWADRAQLKWPTGFDLAKLQRVAWAVATELEWSEAYREQARADLRGADQATEPSVVAMLLQMAYEKVAKAALLRSGMATVPGTQATHAAASSMMAVIAVSTRKCDRLGINRPYFQHQLVPMVRALEDLHPALVRARGGTGPWLEYPWERGDGQVQWPAQHLPSLNGFRPRHAGRAAALADTCHALCERLHEVFA